MITEFVTNVEFQFYGSVKATAGRDSVKLGLAPGVFVFSALEILADEYGGGLWAEIFSASGEIRADLTILHNGVVLDHQAIKDMEILVGDVIALLPSFSGGG